MSEEIDEILKDANHRMDSAIKSLHEHLSSIRTGRASPTLVDKILVDYYGTPTPLFQMASINVPEALMITIKPFDKSSLKDIEKAIQTSDLGINPNNDGSIIRLNFPPLSQERRKELVKQMHHKLEEAKVALRNVRRSAIEEIREYEKESMISEDDSAKGQADIQKLLDKFIEQVDEMGKSKEKDILTV